MPEKGARGDRKVAAIAARQHGVVATAQLTAAGVDKDAIALRLRNGRLHRVHRGVYAVGHARLTFAGRCMGAALAFSAGTSITNGVQRDVKTGNDGELIGSNDECAGRTSRSPVVAVSHHSAAVLWGMLHQSQRPIDVSIASRNGRKPRAGLAIHRPPSLCSEDVIRRDGIPVTRPARTLVDLRRVVPARVFQAALRRAVDLRLVSEEELPDEEHRTRSELERLFLRLCRRHRLAIPEVNAKVGRWEVDFLWREARVIAETDGFRHHGNRLAFERDRVRDAELQRMGYRVLRFTYLQVKESPPSVAAAVRTCLA